MNALATHPGPPGGALLVRAGPGDLTVGFVEGPVIHYDAEGRWCSARLGERFYRRALDGEVVIRRGARVVPVAARDASAVHEAAARFATDLLGRADLPPAARDGLFRAAAWTPERHDGEARRFRETYPEAVPILPPDRTRDVVVLPAIGCPWGRCSFCAFYAGTPFRALGADEIDRHLDAVVRFFGRALPARDGVFLGSASALSLRQDDLLRVLGRVRDVLGPRRRGVAAFQDPDHAPVRSAAEYAELRRAGLTTAFIGLETGSPDLRAALGKSRSLDRLAGAVRAEKDGGLRVALSILVGAGGRAAAAAHRRATAAFLECLPLTRSDLLYLSPLAGALPSAALEEELERFRAEIRAASPARIATYRIGLFRYYT
jgi:hypothetical protein